MARKARFKAEPSVLRPWTALTIVERQLKAMALVGSSNLVASRTSLVGGLKGIVWKVWPTLCPPAFLLEIF